MTIIWYRHGKCIQTSTNMPGIGLVSCEIALENFRILRRQKELCAVKPITAF